MISKRILLFVFILVSCLKLEAQNQEAIKKLAILANKYNTFSKRYVQERVYLHMDNSTYFLGDTLWFKAYVTSSSFHRLSLDSWTLYTELVSPEGQVVEAKKLPIINGRSHGYFDIDTNYQSGFYEIRSYTRAMLSFGDYDLFSRVLPVFKQPTKAGNYNQLLSDYRHYRDSDKSRKKKKTISLSFYPEGGHLLKGVSNILAIKAVDLEGKAVLVKGDILDHSDAKVGSFTTKHRGMCRFTFTANSKKYKARVILGEEKYEFDLPDIEESGVIASINSYSSDENVSLNLSTHGGVSLGEFGIGISCRGQLYYLDVLNAETQLPLALKIPKAKLSTGVHEFVLFDTLGTPLLERKFFISLPNGKYVNEQPYTKIVSIDASNVKNKYKPNEKIGLNFMVKDEKGEPIKTSFSLSIRDPHGNVDTYNNDNVLTHLLLSSEVKGFIPNAAYYFEVDDLARRKELDLLLLVQAWSKYPWKRMADVEPFKERQYVEKGFVISGSVFKNRGRRKPMVDSLMKIILRSQKHTYKGECVADEEGRFNFMFEDIFNNWRASIFLASRDKRDKSLIVLDDNKPPKFKNYSFYEKDVPTPIVDMVEVDSVANNHILEEIQVMSKRKRRGASDYSPIVEDILVNANEFIDLFDELDVNTDLEMNAEHILNYILYKHNLREGTVKYVFRNENDSTSSIGVADLLTRYALFKTFVIYRDSETRNNNEMSYSDTITPIDEVQWENMIETHYDIKVKYRNKRLDGFNEFGDNTESGFEATEESEEGDSKVKSNYEIESRIPDYVVEFVGHSAAENIGETFPYHRFMNFMGYSETKEFYSVDYSKIPLAAPDDYRRTLYWNPEVKTDESGKANIEFYNNSRCEDLNIDAQTITQKGAVGVYEKKGMR